MTKPLRWPKNVETARTGTLAAAMDILYSCTLASEALADGNRDLVRVHLADIRVAAKDIQTAMLLIKHGQLPDEWGKGER